MHLSARVLKDSYPFIGEVGGEGREMALSPCLMPADSRTVGEMASISQDFDLAQIDLPSLVASVLPYAPSSHLTLSNRFLHLAGQRKWKPRR